MNSLIASIPSSVASTQPLDFPQREVEGSLADRFEKVAEHYASRLAVKFDDSCLTYHQLNARANSIAHAVIQQGIACGQPIALLFEPGLSDIAAILGVLKSGHAYVPLDPSYPLARSIGVLEDSCAKLLLTNSGNYGQASRISEGSRSVSDLCILNIDAVASSSCGNPRVKTAPDALAYILYTSGSSGEPKGVMQTHRNVLFDIRRQSIDLQTVVDDRYGLLFSSCSSASVCHIFGALLNGAAVLPFELRQRGFMSFSRWLAAEEITILDINVAMFRQWCATFPSEGTAANRTRFPKLRLLAPGSEPVYQRDVELYHRYFSPLCVMQNALGTTETRTVTQHFITPQTPAEQSVVPVGVAVNEKTVLLLDDDRGPVAQGEIGEIAIRSRYLSPGYWQRPELTAAAFLPDFEGESDQRIYLTGDLGQLREDGLLVHLGRKDFQVKIRGYRVEIAEVEMALFKATGLPAAAAAFEDSIGSQQLAAYLVVDHKRIPTIQELRTKLREHLPEYSVPTRFEFLDALPMTLNGKLNRRALPVPRPLRATSDAQFESPKYPSELEVARLFEEVLGVERVGATDDFFDLGGHSLLAVQLMLRIEQEFTQVLPLSTVVADPTVRQLARSINGVAPATRRSTSVCIQAGSSNAGEPRQPPLFCLPGSGGNALQFHRLASCLEGSLPVYGFDLLGRDGRARPHHTIEAMSRFYLDEVKRIQPQGPYRLCGFSMGGLVAFEMACRLRNAGEKLELLALFDTDCPGHDDLEQRTHWRSRIALRSRLRQRLGQLKFHRHLVFGKTAPRHISDEYVNWLHFKAVKRYVPREYSGCITYFRSVNPQDRRPQHLPDGGWSCVAKAGVEAYDIVGNHRLIQEPFVGELARIMSGCIADVPTRELECR